MTTTVFRPAFLVASLLAAAVLGVTVARSAAPVPAPAPAPSSIALVNLERLFENLAELKARNAQIKTEQDGKYAELTQLDDKIKALEAELKDTIPLSERQKRADKAAEIAESRGILKVRSELLGGTIERKNFEVIRDLYDKAGAAVAVFAAREGYDLVLLDDRSLALPESGSMNGLNSVILSKRILFAKGGVDVTDRLITQMNNEYTAGAPR